MFVLDALLGLAVAALLAYLLVGIYRESGAGLGRGGLSASLLLAVAVLLIGLRLRWSVWLTVASAMLAASLPLVIAAAASSASRFVAARWPTAENRARRDGRIGELLRLYAQAGRRAKALALLGASLPGTAYADLRRELERATDGFYGLRGGAPIARRAGVPGAIVERVEGNLALTGEALWASAERVAAAAAQAVDAPRLAQARERELAKLSRLSGAISEAREGLAELTLSAPGGAAELAEAEAQLRLLGEAAKDLATTTQWQ